MKLTKHPTPNNLANLWMTTHFSNVQAAWFCDVLGEDGGRVDIIAKRLHLSKEDLYNLPIGEAFIYVLPEQSGTENLCGLVNYLDQDVFGFVMAWDGKEFISHN